MYASIFLLITPRTYLDCSLFAFRDYLLESQGLIECQLHPPTIGATLTHKQLCQRKGVALDTKDIKLIIEYTTKV